MKKSNINFTKLQSKKIRNEINKINKKNNIIYRQNKNFNLTQNQTRNNISAKFRNVDNKNSSIKKFFYKSYENDNNNPNTFEKKKSVNNTNQNLMLLNKHYNKEKKIKIKRNNLRPITQPDEKENQRNYKSSDKHNFKNINNYKYKLNSDGYSSNLKGYPFSNFHLNNLIKINDPRSISKSPKRNKSTKPHYKNPELTKKLNSMMKNQLKQYEELRKFYEKEAEINNEYSLFFFPEIKNNNINTNNSQIPLEYFNNYLETYCKEEKTLEFKIEPYFMKNQIEINNKMRAIVVNWLIDVHDRFKLLPDTLFLGIIFFDRYMSQVTNIKKEKLQLIGVTSLIIACKYEEIFSPEIRDFVCILDRTYEKEDLMEQENNMLKILKFEVIFPTSLRYYEILRIEFDIEEKYYNYGVYLLTLCLLDSRFSVYSQATIATTVCFFLKKMFYNQNLKDFLGNNIKIHEKEIQNCLIDICFLIYNIDKSIYNSINKKFKIISAVINNLVFNNIN